MKKAFYIGIDVGGTFTDLVAVDTEGNAFFTKSPSTPEDQSIGVVNGLTQLAVLLQLSLSDLLAMTVRIVHGTTVATNALLERKGAKTALLTTKGHRDILEMREGLKPDRYNLRCAPPEVLVARHLRLGIEQRTGWDGCELTCLNEVNVRQAVHKLKDEGVSAVAVCYLHAYKNSQHEKRTAEIIREIMPEAYISLSSEVLPQIKEYERVSTTVVNAYVGPAMDRYLSRLRQRLNDNGMMNPLFIILSHGGITTLEEATRLSAAAVLSGPAGGIAATKAVAEVMKIPDLLPFDMGGTSTDISLVCDGEAILSTERGLGGERIALRSFDILSIGAGGGSVAHLNANGTFDVGPISAGAWPGPACYGRGGVEPTVTDANLVLGFLDPENILGGNTRLNSELARQAMDSLGEKLGLGADQVAGGIYRLINTKMADGIRLMTLRRGVDPRKFSLLSFGGAAGIHATEVAREMEISRVIVPSVASVLSAWGMLASDLRYEITRSQVRDIAGITDMEFRSIYAALEEEARVKASFLNEFPGQVRIERSAEMRYGEQIYEIDVNFVDIDFEDAGITSRIVEKFHQRHEELYTYQTPDQEVVLVNVHLALVGEITRPQEKDPKPREGGLFIKKHRKIFTQHKWQEVPVIEWEKLMPGQMIEGPAVMEAETTTVILHEGDIARVTSQNWLDINVASTK